MRKHPTSLLRALFYAFGKTFMIAGIICRMSWLVLVVTQVFCLRALGTTDWALTASQTVVTPPLSSMLLLSPVSIVSEGHDSWQWESLGYALGLGIAAILQGYTTNNLFLWGVRGGLRARAAVSLLVFRKMTRLSLAASQGEATSGKVTNIVSNDTRRILEGCQCTTHTHTFTFHGCVCSHCATPAHTPHAHV